jgi:hypothetical protein
MFLLTYVDPRISKENISNVLEFRPDFFTKNVLSNLYKRNWMTFDHFEAAETSYYRIAKRVTLEVSNLGDIPWSLEMLSIEPSKGYDPQLCHCTCIILSD